MSDIGGSLQDFAVDEGSQAALARAEKWHLVLEEMLEVASPEERELLNSLDETVKLAIAAIFAAANMKCVRCGAAVTIKSSFPCGGCGDVFCQTCTPMPHPHENSFCAAARRET